MLGMPTLPYFNSLPYSRCRPGVHYLKTAADTRNTRILIYTLTPRHPLGPSHQCSLRAPSFVCRTYPLHLPKAPMRQANSSSFSGAARCRRLAPLQPLLCLYEPHGPLDTHNRLSRYCRLLVLSGSHSSSPTAATRLRGAAPRTRSTHMGAWQARPARPSRPWRPGQVRAPSSAPPRTPAHVAARPPQGARRRRAGPRRARAPRGARPGSPARAAARRWR